MLKLRRIDKKEKQLNNSRERKKSKRQQPKLKDKQRLTNKPKLIDLLQKRLKSRQKPIDKQQRRQRNKQKPHSSTTFSKTLHARTKWLRRRSARKLQTWFRLALMLKTKARNLMKTGRPESRFTSTIL